MAWLFFPLNVFSAGFAERGGVLEVAIIFLVVYPALRLLRVARAASIAVGIAVFAVLYWLAATLGPTTIVDAGVKLDAKLSYDLLVAIFNPASPLHDGAVVLRGDRIAAACCFLPLSLNPTISKSLGTRHRAALGITEDSDAAAIVVS